MKLYCSIADFDYINKELVKREKDKIEALNNGEEYDDYDESELELSFLETPGEWKCKKGHYNDGKRAVCGGSQYYRDGRYIHRKCGCKRPKRKTVFIEIAGGRIINAGVE